MSNPPCRRSPPQRIDAHNASVDFLLAASGRCGMIHLATGRVCTLAARHPGSCSFVVREGRPWAPGGGGALVEDEDRRPASPGDRRRCSTARALRGPLSRAGVLG
jgi:hypothetical protein